MQSHNYLWSGCEIIYFGPKGCQTILDYVGLKGSKLFGLWSAYQSFKIVAHLIK